MNDIRSESAKNEMKESENMIVRDHDHDVGYDYDFLSHSCHGRCSDCCSYMGKRFVCRQGNDPVKTLALDFCNAVCQDYQ